MTAPANLSPELQIILLCARPEMTTDQVQRLHGLADSGVNWARLISLARAHGLRPLLHRNLRRHCPTLVPEAVEQQLHQAASMSVANTMLLTAELEKILAELEANGIPVIPYKGVTLGERLYGDAALRESGDIDIIVPFERVLEANRSLMSLGYQSVFDLSPRQEDTYLRGTHHYNLFCSRRSISVEVHWDIVSPHFGIPIDWQGVWQRQMRSRVGSIEIRTLCPEDLLLVLCVHGSKHRWEQLKWLTDLAQQIERNLDLDWSVVMHRAREWRVERMVFLGVLLADELLEAPVPDAVMQTVATNGSIVGLSNEVQTVIDRPEGTPEKDLGRTAFLMRIRDRWQDRAGFAWRSLTQLNFQDVGDDDRPVIAYYLQRPWRIVRNNGWQPLTRMGAQMLATLDGRRR